MRILHIEILKKKKKNYTLIFFFLIVWSGTTYLGVVSLFDFNFLIEMYMYSYFVFLVFLRFGALVSYNYQSVFHIFLSEKYQ